jgi:hypothetical protein
MKQLLLHSGQPTFIDDEDFEKLSQHKWYLHPHGYAYRGLCKGHKVQQVLMHTDILGKAPAGFFTDHKSGNKLDNQRGNLRFVNRSVNRRNTQKTKGVYWHKRMQKWHVSISCENKLIACGYFDSEEEARSVAALLKGAMIYHELTKGQESGLR